MNNNKNPKTSQEINFGNAHFFGDFKGGNQTVNNYYKAQNDWIKATNIEEYKYPKFPIILKEKELIEYVLNKGLLMIGGSHEDKSDLAKYIATRLVEHPQFSPTSSDSSPSILELKCDIDTRIDVNKIGERQTEENNATTKVFILYDFRPGHINNNLYEIVDAARQAKNYVIASTDVPRNMWLLNENVKDLSWWEPPHENLYSSNSLAEALIHRIDNGKALSDALKGDVRKLVAEKLNTFASIGRCVRLLNAEKEPLREETIIEAVERAKDGKGSLEKWYYADLNPREQLLALGMSFFDGLFEDQFFAALEEVVNNVWQRRDPTLAALDYCDFENFGNHHNSFKDQEEYELKLNRFKFVKLKAYATDIEIGRSQIVRSNERRVLFEVAWGSHRRQILSALPVIVKLVKDSVAQSQYNWELYGDPIRCNRLRTVISETLSDLGLVSTSATSSVQSALLQLAKDENFDVQEVAASAMVRWYRYDRKEELLGTLQRFYSFAIQEEADTGESTIAKANIGATVALAVSYAATEDYNARGQLSEEFCDWLKELAENQSPIVRDRFSNHTLPEVVVRHLEQLHDNGILKNMAQQHADLNFPIAQSLAIAALVNSQQVRETLDFWYNECIQVWQSGINQEIVTQRNNLLRTAALTYGLILYEQDQRELTVNQSFRRLHRILVEERYSHICQAVVIAICLIAKENLYQIEVLMQALVAKFSEERGKEIAKVFTKIYRDEAKIPTRGEQIPPQLETLLRTVALAYEVIQENEEKGTLTVQEAFRRLSEIFTKEQNSSVCEAAAIAIRILANRHFDRVELQLETLIFKVSNPKRNEIIKILTEIYLDQRANLEGSNEKIKVNGYHYPIWINSERQLTLIEKTIFRWLKMNNNVTAQQIAIQASISFARALEQAEERQINEINKRKP